MRPWRGAPPPHPVHALGVALLALVALSPMVQPWYLLWGMAAVSATAWNGRLGRILAVLSAALVYETHPDGSTPRTLRRRGRRVRAGRGAAAQERARAGR